MNEKHFTILLIFAMFLWGVGWSALKFLTPNISYEVISFWRFFIMFLSFLPIIYFFKEPIKLSKKSIYYVLIGAVLNVTFMILAFLGVKYGSAGGGGVIITTLSPILTFLVMAIILKRMLPNAQIIALFLGLLGGLLMIQSDTQNLISFFNSAEFFFLLCALTWAFVGVLAQYSGSTIHPIHYSFLISIVATIILFFMALPYDILSVFDEGLEFWMALIYLGVLGQSVATTIFFVASSKLGSAKASSFMFLVPIFALISAYALLGEEMKLHIILGGSISLFSVFLINRAKNS